VSPVAPTGNALLAGLGWVGDQPPRVMALMAHPDDETIGLGSQLPMLTQTLIVHVTDGAPRDLKDARAHGFSDAAAYSAARRRELRAAMSLVWLDEECLLSLDFADQEASRHLAPLARAIAALFAEHSPDVVFTHAYEGGHPDHDAVAFAARTALQLAGGAATPLLVEMPYYHGEGGEQVLQRFAPSDSPAITVALPPAAQDLKRRMYSCFVTQRETLERFHVEQETFRIARACDFTQPANGGEILYESFGWGISGADFLSRARAALDELGLQPWL
jgi:LmbE family N-acetylglucosaminyl deacetylase